MDMETVARDSFQVVVYRVAGVTSFSFFSTLSFFVFNIDFGKQ